MSGNATSDRMDWSAFDKLTEHEVDAAARSDADNPPMTDDEIKRLRPAAKAKRIRWKLAMSREEFAARFRIPLASVVAWERYEAEPDEIASAYLDVILADPAAALRALDAATPVKAAE